MTCVKILGVGLGVETCLASLETKVRQLVWRLCLAVIHVSCRMCLGLTIGSFSLEYRFSRGRMKEELLGEILRPISRALGWIAAGALIMLFVYAVVVYVVPVIRRRLYNE